MNLYQSQSAIFLLFAENIPIFPKWSQNSSHLNLEYTVLRIMKNVNDFTSSETHSTLWALFNLDGPGLLSFGS